jgi:hypothetical protein
MGIEFSSRRSFPAAELAAATGARARLWRHVERSGYGRNAARWTAELEDGRRVFVKLALDGAAAGWLRDEYAVYSAVDGPFMPRLAGWHDGDETLIALEDLSEAHWPPPWPPGSIDAVLRALDALHAVAPPASLRRADELRESLNGWLDVAADPEPLVSTELCSYSWLARALPALLQAGDTAEVGGESLLHLDVRSDNLCLRDGEAVLVDWNWASVGNGLLDVVAWLPSLRLEGGPEPWDIVPDSRGLAALIAGFFAARAGLPPPPSAPTVREFQRRQAEIALPWAARELGLPPP